MRSGAIALARGGDGVGETVGAQREVGQAVVAAVEARQRAAAGDAIPTASTRPIYPLATSSKSHGRNPPRRDRQRLEGCRCAAADRADDTSWRSGQAGAFRRIRCRRAGRLPANRKANTSAASAPITTVAPIWRSSGVRHSCQQAKGQHSHRVAGDERPQRARPLLIVKLPTGEEQRVVQADAGDELQRHDVDQRQPHARRGEDGNRHQHRACDRTGNAHRRAAARAIPPRL